MNKINTYVLRNEQTLISQRGFSKKNKFSLILCKIFKKKTSMIQFNTRELVIMVH